MPAADPQLGAAPVPVGADQRRQRRVADLLLAVQRRTARQSQIGRHLAPLRRPVRLPSLLPSFYRVLPGFTEFYWVLPGFAMFYYDLLGFTGFYLVFFSDFTGFCHVLL